MAIIEIACPTPCQAGKIAMRDGEAQDHQRKTRQHFGIAQPGEYDGAAQHDQRQQHRIVAHPPAYGAVKSDARQRGAERGGVEKMALAAGDDVFRGHRPGRHQNQKTRGGKIAGADGVTIRAIMSAVMQTDSQLLSAPKTRANAQLTPRQAKSATAVEKAKLIQDWCTMPRTDKASAASRIAAR